MILLMGQGKVCIMVDIAPKTSELNVKEELTG